MTPQTRVIAAPTRLSLENLPSVSDTFYHEHPVYFGPTGIHPDEGDAVSAARPFAVRPRIGSRRWHR